LRRNSSISQQGAVASSLLSLKRHSLAALGSERFDIRAVNIPRVTHIIFNRETIFTTPFPHGVIKLGSLSILSSSTLELLPHRRKTPYYCHITSPLPQITIATTVLPSRRIGSTSRTQSSNQPCRLLMLSPHTMITGTAPSANSSARSFTNLKREVWRKS
jgi:hypothetical protein